jgi:hypothetical protein
MLRSNLATSSGWLRKRMSTIGWSPGSAGAIHSTGTVSVAGFVRRDFFATMVLADAHLVAGDLEQACVTALRVPTADQLKCADDEWP